VCVCVSERERQRKETAIDDKKGACLCFCSGTGAFKECEYMRVSKMKERLITLAIVFTEDIRVLIFHVILM
jgi:hypothetical protein